VFLCTTLFHYSEYCEMMFKVLNLCMEFMELGCIGLYWVVLVYVYDTNHHETRFVTYLNKVQGRCCNFTRFITWKFIDNKNTCY
jgi:hypothetical protein